MSRGKQLPPESWVQIEVVGDDGFGHARHEGFQLQVRNALEDESVQLRVLRRKRRRLETQAMVLRDAHPDRVTPACPWTARCGGCLLQHLNPAAQRDRKRRRLADLLADAGVPGPERWLEDLTGPELGYRHKARLGMRLVPGRDGLLIGFREPASSRVADIPACRILAPAVGERIAALRVLLGSLSIPARLPQLEVACGEDAVALVLRHLEPLSDVDRAALCDWGQGHGVHWYLQPGGPDTVSRLWPATGPERLHYSQPDFGLRFAFHPLDFVQINPEVNRRMVVQALELLAPGPDDRVLDLFCGLGNFTLPLATRSARVTGVEGSVALVQRAEENAHANAAVLRAAPAFTAADLYSADFDPAQLPATDLLLLDPPRSGAEAVCRGIGALAPERVLYVSCHPETLARDARLLLDAGYRLRAAGIMDMFPHTAHVESMALFERDPTAAVRGGVAEAGC